MANKTNKMEVLIAHDYEDGSSHVIATMSAADQQEGNKAQPMCEFLTDHYAAWLDTVDEEDREDYIREIEEAVERLANGESAECCGDCLYWETVTHF